MAASIPFAFIAGKKVMPARRYELTQSAASGSSFAIRNADGITAFVIAGIPEKGSPDRPHLTFACYGKECVLAKIGPPQSMTAYSLSQRSIEKNLHTPWASLRWSRSNWRRANNPGGNPMKSSIPRATTKDRPRSETDPKHCHDMRGLCSPSG